ncbi:GNAT family N-acetyltransferase [Microbacterium koreense]|uniref:GNAT family N-acetyltransferase n=1 Tax=Microbacterium koreense TaxID=323761 RepID=A0ABW2ZVG3_9MICO
MSTTAERIGAVSPRLPEHAGIAVWRPATTDDVTALTALMQAADRVDHPSWLTPREDVDEMFESSWIDPESDTLVGLDDEGDLVAVGCVSFHPSRDERLQVHLQGRVHPRVRRRGIGNEVLRWERERARAALVAVDSPLPAAITFYADEPDVGSRHLAEACGMRVERWFTSMDRSLADAIGEPEMVAEAGSIDVVNYDASWRDATLTARNDAFRDHWGSLPTPHERWVQFVEGPFLRPDLSWLAVEGDRVVGLALGTVNEEDWEPQGYSSVYIDLIGVTRDRRGRRIAPALIARLLRSARDAGLDKAVLDVDTENPSGALGLYERLGFVPTERSLALVERL